MSVDPASQANENAGDVVIPSEPVTDLDALMAQAREAAEKEAQEPEATETESVQESQETETPPDQVQDRSEDGEKDEDETAPFSRRDAKRYWEKLQESERRVRETEAELAAKADEDKRLADEVMQVLGTAEAYEQAKRTALDPSQPRAERDNAAVLVQRYDANRQFFSKLQQAARNSVLGSVARDFEEASKLEGVDRKVILGPSVAQAFKHVYEAGMQKAIEEKDAIIAKLETELKGAKAAAASNPSKAPLQGGSSSGGLDFKDWFDEDGILKDDIERMALSGQLRG